MSTQNAVLQAYQKDRDTNQKRKADGHVKITEGITNLARKQAEYETRCCVLDKDFDTREATRRSQFDADTVKHNKINEEMETSEHHREIQRRLVKAMKRNHEKLQKKSE